MVLTIHVPEHAKILIKPGQKVDFNIPFYEILGVSDYEIPLSKKLEVKPDKIFHYLKKFVGEDVKKGEILAVKKTLFSTHKVLSENDGKIKEINHDIGLIIISVKNDEANKVKTYFKGEVTEIKNREIHLKVENAKTFSLKKLSGEFGGEVFYLNSDKVPEIISANLEKKYVVTSLVTSYLESKVEALGIAGYITLHKLPEGTSLPYAQLKEIEDEKTIMKEKFPYCVTDTKSSTITFYR